jgi:hypothetical protein
MLDPIEKILQRASEFPHGMAVLCQSPDAADRLRRLLYVRRAKAREREDTSYDHLSISFSPHAGDILYIYPKPPEEPHE